MDQERTKLAQHLRESDPSFASWSRGYGAISHSDDTQIKVSELLSRLSSQKISGDGVDPLELLCALDRLTNAAMWLIVHQTYARNVHMDGRALEAHDFKKRPEGHTGGSLNMAPGYAAYLAANVLSGTTRGWLMGQGHSVAAIDSLNLLVNNLSKAHAQRYSLSDQGLSRYVRDFYLYALNAQGKQESPLGSHVNAYTAGGLAEGGYLGFAQLQYVHMPLPGERLVAFLSDGAFEEQRGGDWAARWWRREDTGTVVPIMINNGRRIDQRTTMAQQGGTEWFCEHLELNGFDAVVFDGRDPAAFVWAILELEYRLETSTLSYPVLFPYGIAVAPKGAGFPGEGSNLAHNLPISGNPSIDPQAAKSFNDGISRLWVSPQELKESVSLFQKHDHSQRVQEKDNVFVSRDVSLKEIPSGLYHRITQDIGLGSKFSHSSPMRGVDEIFAAILEKNSHLRARVGNPDEMKSNRLLKTLELLKFRVTDPEPGIPESVLGGVITALNEEAVASAAFANKAGINLIHTYEAFGTKMLGAARQEIIFSNHCMEAGREQGWLSIPIVLTSHTWENGKNEQSHQDPSMCEAMMTEPFNVSRVVFPPDYNSAMASIERLYQSHGQIWTLVVPKADVVPELFSESQAKALVNDGASVIDWASHKAQRAQLGLYVTGSYQLIEALRAGARLKERDIPFQLSYIYEPARFRSPSSVAERKQRVEAKVSEQIFPSTIDKRLFLSHTHPSAILGALSDYHTGSTTKALGFINQGGTLNTAAMLFVNRASWCHILLEACGLLGLDDLELLSEEELEALAGQRSPHGIVIPGIESRAN